MSNLYHSPALVVTNFQRLTPIRRNNRGTCGAEAHMTAVTAFGSSVCNYTKGELLIHAANRFLLRPDAHQGRFLPFENLRAVRLVEPVTG